MIDRERFVAEGRARWQALDALLSRQGRLRATDWTELSALYRSVAADLSRARSHDLPADVQGYLDDLAARAHNRLYGVRRRGRIDVLGFVAAGIPRRVRASARWFWLAAALFYGPLVLCAVGAAASEEFAFAVVPEAQLRDMEAMYREETERPLADSLAMTGFYVWNNVGIAFRTFSTGALAGLGSAFFLIHNGVTIGTTFGHLGAGGQGRNLLGFVAGHAAWELTGIVLAGAAGLRLGWALVATGGRTRAASVRAAAPELFGLMAASTLLLLVAAAIEGLWSASGVPLPARLLFGVVQVAVVAGWLLFGGRR